MTTLCRGRVKIACVALARHFRPKVTLMSCAPFVSSPHDVVKKMLEVARASKDDVLCDLGCGDGRILTTAVKDFGIKAAVGYEIREDLFKQASGEVEKLKLVERVH